MPDGNWVFVYLEVLYSTWYEKWLENDVFQCHVSLECGLLLSLVITVRARELWLHTALVAQVSGQVSPILVHPPTQRAAKPHVSFCLQHYLVASFEITIQSFNFLSRYKKIQHYFKRFINVMQWCSGKIIQTR